MGAIPAGYLINKYIPTKAIIDSDKLPLPSGIQNFLLLHGEKALSIVADTIKGMTAIYIVAYLGGVMSGGRFGLLIFPFVSPGLIHSGALIFVVLGHVFSVYVCGWGGRGFATAFGGFLFLMPKAAIVAVLVFIVAILFKKSIQFASIVTSWALPIIIWYFYRMNIPYQVAAVALAVLSLITHYKFLHPEISDERQ